MGTGPALRASASLRADASSSACWAVRAAVWAAAAATASAAAACAADSSLDMAARLARRAETLERSCSSSALRVWAAEEGGVAGREDSQVRSGAGVAAGQPWRAEGARVEGRWCESTGGKQPGVRWRARLLPGRCGGNGRLGKRQGLSDVADDLCGDVLCR